MEPRECPACHNLFIPTTPTQKYCNRDCYNLVRCKPQKGICPVCSIAFTACPSAHKKYCSRDCYLTAIDGQRNVICPVCDKEFTSYKSHNAIYCSRKCYLALDKQKTSICPVCSKEFTYYPSAYDTGIKSYCSRKCQRMDARIGAVCPHCGKTFWYQRSWPLVYCSALCYRLACQGENHHNWCGGPQPCYYGPNWPSQRRNARRRDNYTCQRCGITEKECVRQLDVHHVIPFKEFGLERYKEANVLKNLICYCKACHLIMEPRNGTVKKA